MISDFFEIFLLSVVQGVSEFLPISSAAHLILISNIYEFKNQSLLIDISLHLGSLIAILFYFRDDIFNIWSVTKSFISALFGQMIDQGLLKDEFISIDEFFPDLTDETKKTITVSQLLTMTSGIQDDLSYMYSANPSDYILNFDLSFSPGSWWAYTSAGTHILSIILNKILLDDFIFCFTCFFFTFYNIKYI